MTAFVSDFLHHADTGKPKGGRTPGGEKRLLGPRSALIGAFTAAGLLSGCINITAPQDPIVIELNVNIRAEVLYRLVEDANETIDRNADIF